MDYGFAHNGIVHTPNGTAGISASSSDARNAAISADALKCWETRPERFTGYYSFPAESLPLFGRPRTYRAEFAPCLHTFVNVAPGETGHGLANKAVATLWTGEIIGRITSARVYRHNFGARMVSITVKGTNGATYYGRASWDNGTVINLRRVGK